MESQEKLKADPQAVQFHLNILQSTIQRMAENSSSSKTWCITLVSAILVVVADTGKDKYAFIAVIPSILFFFLDTYYLSLEKGFRNSYNDFVTRLHSDQVDSSELFLIKPKGKQISLLFQSLKSFSVWPFYLTIIIMIFVAKQII